MKVTKGQRTAGRILDAAEASFASKGLEATSLREIAAEVQIQQPGLYKHFESKEELYRQVYARALLPLAEVMDGVLRDGSVEDSVNQLASKLTDLLADHPNISKLLVRALISDEGDAVAMAWIDELIGYGRRISERAGVGENADLLALQVTGMFNVLFGYFWAAPIIEKMTGKCFDNLELKELQKHLLEQFVLSFSEQ